MSILKCRFCGADTKRSDSACPSCGAPLGRPSELKDEDIRKISAFLLSAEKALKAAKKKADWKIGLAFLCSAVLWGLASWYIYRSMRGEMLIGTGAIILTGFIIFITFGFFVGFFEQRAMDAVFEKKLRNDIREYLDLTGYTAADVTVAAGSALDEKAELNSYLADI